jgi:hypothetical protein
MACIRVDSPSAFSWKEKGTCANVTTVDSRGQRGRRCPQPWCASMTRTRATCATSPCSSPIRATSVQPRSPPSVQDPPVRNTRYENVYECAFATAQLFFQTLIICTKLSDPLRLRRLGMQLCSQHNSHACLCAGTHTGTQQRMHTHVCMIDALARTRLQTRTHTKLSGTAYSSRSQRASIKVKTYPHRNHAFFKKY